MKEVPIENLIKDEPFERRTILILEQLLLIYDIESPTEVTETPRESLLSWICPEYTIIINILELMDDHVIILIKNEKYENISFVAKTFEEIYFILSVFDYNRYISYYIPTGESVICNSHNKFMYFMTQMTAQCFRDGNNEEMIQNIIKSVKNIDSIKSQSLLERSTFMAEKKKNYRVLWFELSNVVKDEGIIEADSEQDAIRIAHLRYPVDKKPASMCSATLE